jgi:hypothetical protein
MSKEGVFVERMIIAWREVEHDEAASKAQRKAAKMLADFYEHEHNKRKDSHKPYISAVAKGDR